MYYFFGAGQNCYGALAFFGKDKVKAVIDNSPARQGMKILGVPIISFDEFLEKKKDETVIITTIACSQEIGEQLKKNDIYNFFVCPYMQSGFYKCDEIIQLFNLLQYRSFAIYGKNPVSEHLMDEISKKMGYKCEKYFISEAEWRKEEQISADVLLIVKCRLPRYLTKPRQRRSEWDMAGSDGISRVSTVFRGKSLLTNKMRII